MLFPERPEIASRDDLEAHIFNLMDHNDAVQWRSDTVYSYLQAMAQWLHESKLETPSWQCFADMLEAAAGDGQS